MSKTIRRGKHPAEDHRGNRPPSGSLAEGKKTLQEHQGPRVVRHSDAGGYTIWRTVHYTTKRMQVCNECAEPDLEGTEDVYSDVPEGLQCSLCHRVIGEYGVVQ